MGALMNWMAELNHSHHWWFAILTVVMMSGVGLTIGTSIEVIFRILDIRYDKIEIKHEPCRDNEKGETAAGRRG